MKHLQMLGATALLLASALGGCQRESDAPAPAAPAVPNTPFTPIGTELVGTWYAHGNAGPLTAEWNQGTFPSPQPYTAEYRTLVFAQNGKNAVEYTAETVTIAGQPQRRFNKVTGTLELQAGSAGTALTFHAQSGLRRVFSAGATGYTEATLALADLQAYSSELRTPQATTYFTGQNFLLAERIAGSAVMSVRYWQVAGSGSSQRSNPSGNLYARPPATGTYVQVGGLYYPTAVIGNREWMTVNYAGPGGMADVLKPRYGTFLLFDDLPDLPVPAGWRVPTRQDYVNLLASQGLALNAWDTTNSADPTTKPKLGQLMAPNTWNKLDGLATNTSGFTALPANFRTVFGTPAGQGSTSVFWTSEVDAAGAPLAFQITQLATDTYASLQPWPAGLNPPHIPVRLVRNK